MAFSGVWQGSTAAGVWVDAAAGSVLVAVVGTRGGTLFGAPAAPGWTLIGAETAAPTEASGSREWVAVWWRVAAAPTTHTFTLPADAAAGGWVVVYGYTGPRAVTGAVLARPLGQAPVWPAVTGGSGDAVRLSLMPGASYYPPGTDRAGSPWLSTIQVRDATVSAGVPSVAAAGGSGPRSGVLWSLLLSGVTPPTPTLSGPSGVPVGGVDTWSWTATAGQTGRAVRRRIGTGAYSYLSAAGTWVSTVQWVSSADTSVTISGWTAGVYQMSVAVAVGEDQSNWSSPLLVTCASAPPAPAAITVAPLTTRRPTVTITPGAGSGTVAGYRLQVRAAGVTVEEATVPASGVWPAVQRWPDQVTVAAATVLGGGVAGGWLTVPVTLTVPAVPTPTVQAVQVSHPVSGLPGVRLVVAAPGSYTVEVSVDGADPLTASMTDSTTIDDYSPGSVYTVRLRRTDGELSGAVTVTVASITEGQAGWLIDPLHPELAVQVPARSDGGLRHELRASTAVYLDDPQVSVGYAGPALTPGGVWTVWAYGEVAAQKALVLLRGQRPLRYRWPATPAGRPGRVDVFLPVSVSAPRVAPDVNVSIWPITVEWEAADAATTGRYI